MDAGNKILKIWLENIEGIGEVRVDTSFAAFEGIFIRRLTKAMGCLKAGADDDIKLELSYIAEWAVLKGISRFESFLRTLPYTKTKSDKKPTFRRMIKRCVRKGSVTKEESIFVNEVYDIRNSIAHQLTTQDTIGVDTPEMIDVFQWVQLLSIIVSRIDQQRNTKQ